MERIGITILVTLILTILQVVLDLEYNPYANYIKGIIVGALLASI